MDDAAVAAAPGHCTLFDAVPGAALLRVALTLRRRGFCKGEVIFHTQSDLAAMIWGTWRSVTRLLNPLVDDGLVRHCAGTLTAVNADALLRVGERRS